MNVSGTHQAALDFPVPGCKNFTNINRCDLLVVGLSATNNHNAQRHFKYDVKIKKMKEQPLQTIV